MQQLHRRYSAQARESIVNALSSEPRSVVPFEDLYGKAMAFPVVSRDDLSDWLQELPQIKIELNGPRRKKLLLFKGDRVSIINSQGLRELLAEMKKGQS